MGHVIQAVYRHHICLQPFARLSVHCSFPYTPAAFEPPIRKRRAAATSHSHARKSSLDSPTSPSLLFMIVCSLTARCDTHPLIKEQLGKGLWCHTRHMPCRQLSKYYWLSSPRSKSLMPNKNPTGAREAAMHTFVLSFSLLGSPSPEAAVGRNLRTPSYTSVGHLI